MYKMKTKQSPIKSLIATLAATACTLALAVTISPILIKDAQADDGKETFVFAMDGQYPPFNTRQGDRIYGFDVDIGEAISRKMGMHPEPAVNPWQTLIAALKADRFDAIIGSMAITEERQKEVSFSEPYYTSGAQVFVKKDDDRVSIESLKGQRIGVLVSSTFQKVAREMSEDVQTYPSDITALNDLTVPGRLDAVITDQLVGEHAIQESGLPLRKLGKPLYVDKMGIAVNKGDDELLERINTALEEIIADGTYAAISEKYFGRNILAP